MWQHKFAIMKWYHVTLLSFIVLAVINQNFVESRYPAPPDKLQLRIKNEKGNIVNIDLIRVETFLANHNLPLKMTLDDKAEKYGDIDKNIMKHVGEFYMYHDLCTKSAFVYFRKKGILNGVVSVTYSVIGLPISKSDQVLEVENGGGWKYLRFFRSKKYVMKSHGRNVGAEETTRIRKRRNGDKKKLIYVELLVTISHDMHKELGNNYVETVSHVLTVYNAVDMLYRLVKSVSIRINFAAIVIETIKDAWNFIPKMKSDTGIEIIDATTVCDKISFYYQNKVNYFPRDSYDIVIYNTRAPLRGPDLRKMLGVSKKPLQTFMFPPGQSRYSRTNLAVRDFKLYESYSIIAHELAHVFGAKHDGEGPEYHDDDSCGLGSIMAAKSCFTACPEWSRQTEREFKKYFSTPSHCHLINEPRSLFSPKPRKVLTGLEQCRCYGYHSFDSPMHGSHNWWCREALDCLDQMGNTHEAPSPMDGTPCGGGKVCWEESCVAF